MNDKTPIQLIEDGFVEICRGTYRIRESGNPQSAFDQLGVVISCLSEMRKEIATAHPNILQTL